MTTINEDSSSWRAGGVSRRDFRSERGMPELFSHRSRKNTGKWCKGKVGTPHQGRYQEWDYGFMKLWGTPPTMVSVCINCGKRLEMVFPPADVRQIWKKKP